MLIRCESVSKVFIRHTGHQLLRHKLSSWMRRRTQGTPFRALSNVSFELRRGESLGIVGHNGAGKSTLLSIVSGLSHPDSGTIRVEGTVTPLLELGSGFHPDLTGEENIELNASLLGFTQKQTERLFDAIVDFSGIGDFIEEPLRTYSAGMMMRLAFSVAVNLDPDILIIDEVIAVGDKDFQRKCFDRIARFRKAGKSLVCVSHSPSMLVELCDQGMWLDHGEVMIQGEIGRVLATYDAGLDSLAATAGESKQ